MRDEDKESRAAEVGNLLNIGTRIRQARRDAGLTQSQLGRLLGDSQAAVAQIESRHWVGETVLAKYARALGKTLAFFLEPNAPVGPAAPDSSRGETVESVAATAEARQRRVRRMALINRAYRVLLQDATFAGGARSGGVLDLEAKKELVRRYEAARGVRLLPPDIV